MDVEAPSPEDLSPVPVDLEELADALEGDPLTSGGVLDLDTGEVWSELLIEASREASGVDWDVESIEHPLEIDNLGSRAAYTDMCEFVESLGHTRLAEKLEVAVRGRGAFARFRDVLREDDPAAFESYLAMDRARKIDRAAAWLGEHGYRSTGRSG